MYGAQCSPGPDGDVERLVEDAGQFRGRAAPRSGSSACRPAGSRSPWPNTSNPRHPGQRRRAAGRTGPPRARGSPPGSAPRRSPARRPGRRRRGRSGCRPPGSTGKSVGWVGVAESPPVPPSRHGRRLARGPTYSAPVPVGPNSDLCPGNASRSMHRACTSIGTTPAVWAASTRNSRSRLADDAADLGDGLDGAEDVAGVGERRRAASCGVIAASTASGSTVPPASAGTRVRVIRPGLRQRDERPARRCCVRGRW